MTTTATLIQAQALFDIAKDRFSKADAALDKVTTEEGPEWAEWDASAEEYESARRLMITAANARLATVATIPAAVLPLFERFEAGTLTGKWLEKLANICRRFSGE